MNCPHCAMTRAAWSRETADVLNARAHRNGETHEYEDDTMACPPTSLSDPREDCYRITSPDGTVRYGSSREYGLARTSPHVVRASERTLPVHTDVRNRPDLNTILRRTMPR